MNLLLHIFACACAVIFYFAHQRGRNTSLPLPPGPSAYPTLENLREFAQFRPWERWARWRQRYGDVIHLNIFGMRLIVLNTAAAASALLDKRSAAYANRPWFTMLNEMMGFDWPILVQSGERLKKSRTLASKYFINKIHQYKPTQEREAHALIKRLSGTPEEFMRHCKLYAVNVVLRFGYGFMVHDVDDPLLLGIEVGLDYFSGSRFMVDFFPILKYWPEWLPGGEFKRIARDARQAMSKMRDVPFAKTKALIAEGDAEACFVSTLLRDMDLDGDVEKQEEVIRDCAGTMYAAGTHTTAASIISFVLAMIQFPEVQQRAQEEINRVIGSDRLPNFSDREDLPYLDCVLKELQRWTVPTPVGMPHCAVEDDIYDGYLIPKGTMVMGNLWAIFRDPDTFPEPERFNPSRFMTDDRERLERIVNMAFGWGRRACPGRHLAEASLFITTACCLATLNFSKPRGVGIDHEYKWVNNALRSPLPFECTITVRSEKAQALIDAL